MAIGATLRIIPGLLQSNVAIEPFTTETGHFRKPRAEHSMKLKPSTQFSVLPFVYRMGEPGDYVLTAVFPQNEGVRKMGKLETCDYQVHHKGRFEYVRSK